ncbi:MAG: hypothetical protein ACQGVC_01095 [Myxococcota bacterium]
MSRERRAAAWLSTAASSALVAYLYWPVLRCAERCFVDPVAVRGAGLGHIELPDLHLNAWILAWVQHALSTDWGGLFDANAFHPAPAVLTQSEHMLGVALWTFPLRAFSSEAVWLHQAALVGSSWILALTTAALVRWLSGSVWAGFAAGAAAVFMPWRTTELAHVQLMNAQWFPWVWLALGRVVEEPERRRHAVWLALALGLQLLSSFYLGYFVLLSCAGLLVGLALTRGVPARAWRRLAPAFAAPLAALAAVSLPYLRWREAQGFQAVDVLFDSVPPADVLALTRPELPTALRTLPVETSYAVPLVVFLLAAAAFLCFRGSAPGDAAGRPARLRGFALGLLLACVGAGVLALGRRLALEDAHLPLPGSLAAAFVPGYENLRNPLRFAIVIGVAAPVLAGMGWAQLEAWAASTRARAALRAGLLALLAWNLWLPPLPALDAWQGREDRRAVYEALEDLPAGPLLEIPWPLQVEHDAIHAGRAMLGSTLHWRPLLNGHSGYAPASYPLLRQVAQDLPDAGGLARLLELVEVRWVLVHRDALSPEARRAWDRAGADAGLRPVLTRGAHVLFEVTDRRPGRFREALARATRRDTTLAGLPRTPLPAAEQRGALRLDVDGAFHLAGRRRLQKSVGLVLRNDGERVWPGLDPDPQGLVRLRAVFLDAEGRVAADASTALAADVPPGETRLRVPVAPPERPGRYRLRASLVQRLDGAEVPLAIGPDSVDVEVRAAL